MLTRQDIENAQQVLRQAALQGQEDAGFVLPRDEVAVPLRSDNAPFVPLAERVYPEPVRREFVHQTIWENTTDRDIYLDLHVGTTPVYSPKARAEWRECTQEERRERQSGTRKYVIRAKSKAAIPSEFDVAIQHTKCLDQDCSRKALYCKNRSHKRMIVAGLCPQGLVNMGWQHVPTISPALDTTLMKQAEAEKLQAEAIAAKNNAEHRLTIANERIEEANKEARELQARTAKAEAELERAKALLGAKAVESPPQAGAPIPDKPSSKPAK
jgi:hypothetical protein